MREFGYIRCPIDITIIKTKMSSQSANNQDQKDEQIQNILKDLDKSEWIIHTVQRGDKTFSVKISPTAEPTRAFEISTPPLLVQWPKLHDKGNLGSKFATEESQAVFECNVSQGNMDDLAALVGESSAELLSSCNVTFFNLLDGMFRDFQSHLFKDKNFLAKKKKSFVALARKQVASASGEDIKSIAKDDTRVTRMAFDMFEDNGNTFVNRDRGEDTAFVRVKQKVWRTPWGSDPSVEPTITPIPIFDAEGNVINEDNSEAIVNSGDLVSVKMSLRPYVIPSGAYGISLSLRSVTKIKEGGRSSKRRKTSHSFSAWAV